MRDDIKPLVVARGLGGALLGGLLGAFTFYWLFNRGFYALALPGAFIGWGCAIATRRRSYPLAAICGVAALILTIYLRWTIDARSDELSLGQFTLQIPQLNGVTQLMIALSAIFAFWFARGRDYGVRREEV